MTLLVKLFINHADRIVYIHFLLYISNLLILVKMLMRLISFIPSYEFNSDNGGIINREVVV